MRSLSPIASMKPEDQGKALSAGIAAESRLKEAFMSTRSGNTAANFSGPGSRMAGDIFSPKESGLISEIGKLGTKPGYFEEWSKRAQHGPGMAQPGEIA